MVNFLSSLQWLPVADVPEMLLTRSFSISSAFISHPSLHHQCNASTCYTVVVGQRIPFPLSSHPRISLQRMVPVVMASFAELVKQNQTTLRLAAQPAALLGSRAGERRRAVNTRNTGAVGSAARGGGGGGRKVTLDRPCLFWGAGEPVTHGSE